LRLDCRWEGKQALLNFFKNLSAGEAQLLHFIESRLGIGVMQRQFGSDEMLWSRGIFKLLDLDPEKDKPSFSLLQGMKHPEDRLTFSQVESKYEVTGVVSRKFRVIRRDGTLRVLSQQAELLFDANGTPEQIISVVIDITDQDVVRDQARMMEWRLSAFFRHSNLMLNLLRPDGYVTRVFASSPVDEEEQSRRLGFRWQDLIHPEDRAESLVLFEKATAARLPATREHRVLQADGTYRWRRAIWIPVFDSQHSLIEYMSLSQDIEKEKNIVSLTDKSRPITGAQIRAGRALVHWSVQQLAEAADLSSSVVRRIEDFDGVSANASAGGSLERIRSALCREGVEFLFPPLGKPGVRPV